MKHQKIYDGYKKKAGFPLNFQLCRAYLGDNYSVSRVVELILLTKFRNELAGDEKGMEIFLSKVRAIQGKPKETIIELPRLGFKDSVENILATFVERKFDKMVEAVKISLGQYPLTFRDIIEQAEAQRHIEQSS